MKFGKEFLAGSQGARFLAKCPEVRRIVLAWWHPAEPPVPFGFYGGKNGSEAPFQVANHRSVGLGERVMASRLETGDVALDGENVVLFDDDTSLTCSGLRILIAASDRWPDKIAAPYQMCRRIHADESEGNMVYSSPPRNKWPWMNVAITPAIVLKTALLRRAERVMPAKQVEWSSKNLQGEDVMLNWAVAKVSSDGRAAVCVGKMGARGLASSDSGGSLSWAARKNFSKQDRWRLYLEFRGNVSDHVARALPLDGHGLCEPAPAVLAKFQPRHLKPPVLVQSHGDDGARPC